MNSTTRKGRCCHSTPLFYLYAVTLSAHCESDKQGKEQKEEEPGADAAGKVPVLYKEGYLVVKIDLALKGLPLPPVCACEDVSPLVYEGADAGVPASGYVATGLDGAQRGVAEMLLVSRSVTPPGIIRYDREGLRTLLDISGTVFSVNAFVTDCTSYGHLGDKPAVTGIPVHSEQGGLVLAHASAHHSSKLGIERSENLGIWHLLRSHHQAGLVVEFIAVVLLHYKRGVVGLHPNAIPNLPGCIGRGIFTEDILMV